MGNVAKGTRRGLITVLANDKQSSNLKAILKSLQETTGIKDLAGWEDIAGLIENENLVLDPAAAVVVDDLIKKMQAEENGVTSRLGVDLTIDEAYAADEAARKMRLIVAQLENAANSGMPAGQLEAVQKQLKEDYDALSLVRENILTNQTNIDTNKTKSNDADVSFQSSQGWLLYEQVMLNESVAQVMGDYSKLDNIAKQKGYAEASRLLKSQDQENITLEDIKNQVEELGLTERQTKKIISGLDKLAKQKNNTVKQDMTAIAKIFKVPENMQYMSRANANPRYNPIQRRIGIPFERSNLISSLMPDKMSMLDAVKAPDTPEELKSLYASDEKVQQTAELASKLE
jgi:hypothetical protein